MKKSHLSAIVAVFCALGASALYCVSLSSSETAPEPGLEDAGAEPGPPACMTPVQTQAGAFNPAALRELLSQGHSASAASEAEPALPLDICLKSMQYLALGESPDGLEHRSLEILDMLLEHGARPGCQTKDFLPIDDALKSRVLEMLRRHGIEILAGDNPENPCCVPY